MRLSSWALKRSSQLAVFVIGAGAIALGLIGPAAAQVIPGPLKVTDSGPGVLPSGFAIKGITSYSTDSGLFGYGTSQMSGTGIDGVTGYVESSSSVGVVGWASSGATGSYGVYGYSGVGNGVFGQSGSSSASSIFGVNSNPSGNAIYGYAAGEAVLGVSTASDGVVGITQYPYSCCSSNIYAGVLGIDNAVHYGQVGVAGMSTMGVGVYGTSSSGDGVAGSSSSEAGVFGASDTGSAGVFDSTEGDGLFVNVNGYGTGYGDGLTIFSHDVMQALVGSTFTGVGGAFFGYSGNATYPVVMAISGTPGSDLIGAYTPKGESSTESFIVQAGTANFSGNAPANSSDVQVSGDLYVQGQVYALCSSSGGTFPVTAPSGHCSYDGSPSPAIRSKSSSGSDLEMYSARQSVPTVEDFGEARLINGEATVPLEQTFASTADLSRSYLVFTSPEGDCRGLYIASKSAAGFTVRELMHGHSTIAFQCRIVAHPYADLSARLPLASKSHTLALRSTTLRLTKSSPKAFGWHRFGHLTPGALPRRLPAPTVNASLKR